VLGDEGGDKGVLGISLGQVRSGQDFTPTLHLSLKNVTRYWGGQNWCFNPLSKSSQELF
jgi:hypothetical protein